jgi:hypothetical protein
MNGDGRDAQIARPARAMLVTTTGCYGSSTVSESL